MTDGEMLRFGFLFTVGVFLALLVGAAGLAFGIFLGKVIW